MSFGGAVKLTGESEYRKALRDISQNLREVTAQMKLTSTEYDKNDKSSKALTAQSNNLNDKLNLQKNRVSQLEKQYQSMSTQYEKNSKKHDDLIAKYDKEKAELDSIEKELGKTSTKYQDQKKVVDELAKQVTKSSNAQEQNTKTMSNMRIEISNAQADVNKTAKALNELGKEEEDAGKKAKEASKGGFTVLKGVLADLTSKAIQSAIAGMKKLGSTAIDVGKQAIESYADYEQLVGGVETLFKDSAGIVQDYANQAYKSSGLSANQYMETITSFSASLLQGLNGDTAKAAKIADMAIIDMSDNANKMGTSMEMITNAYQGFAKGNFQMLDNLKLGYGGTKEEMARLINESGVMGDTLITTGKNGNFATVSFAKMVEAIHKVQENMGITGTTAKEASSTIQGSASSMRSAWKNLLTGIADDTQDTKKLVKNFTDSVITYAKNLVPRIKISVDGIKKLVNSIITEVFPKLKKEVPELKPLINTFEWFIKNKDLVVGAMKAIVGAFAVAKVLQFTKGITDFTTSIKTASGVASIFTGVTKTMTIAQTAQTVATNAGTAATNLFNKALSANPLGLVLTLITTGITLYSIFKGKTDEATEAQKAQSKAIEENTEVINDSKKSWDDLVKARQESINTGMTELSNYQSLYKELKGLVDENGKVKDGYEARASFITTTLKNALGVEIEMVDGVIQGYGEISASIDQLMEKKKAEIILNSQEELYTKAINGRTEATKNLLEAERLRDEKVQERTKLEETYNARLQQLTEQYGHLGEATLQHKIENDSIIKQKLEMMAKNDEETANLEANYNTQKELIAEYAYNIDLYEKNMALAHEGNYDAMSTVTWEHVKDYQNAGDAKRAELETEIKYQEAYVEELKTMTDENGKYLYESQVNSSEERLRELKESLKQYNSTTRNELYNNEKSWLENSATVLSNLSDKKIEFKKVGDEQVQMYVDGIAQGQPMAELEAETITRGVLKEFDKYAEAEGAGENLITGFTNGEGNMSLQNAAFTTARSFAGSILTTLKNKLGIKSPSKETKKMGAFLIQGLGIGIEKEEDSVFKQMNTFGKNTLNTLRNSLSGNISTGIGSNLATEMNALTRNAQNEMSTSYNFRKTNKNDNVLNQNAEYTYNNMVSAFKEALSQMTVELDDENMGKFVENTIQKAIYT